MPLTPASASGQLAGTYGSIPGPNPPVGRISFYWALPEYIPVPDGWHAILRQEADGSLRFDSGPGFKTEAMCSRDLVALVAYQQVPVPSDALSAAAVAAARRVNLPHFDSPDSVVPEWSKFELDETQELDPVSAGPSSLTHITVAHMVAAVSVAPTGEEVSEAFDECLDLVWATHRGLHAVTGLGWIKPTGESEKLGVLVGLDRVDDGKLVPVWPLGTFLLSTPMRHSLDSLTVDQLSVLKHAELSAVQRTPRSLVSDLQAHAVGAAHRAGDTRVAIVMAATTCEAWSDLLLACLLWEEGASPEEAALELQRYRDTFERLNRLVAPRLRGRWDHQKVGELRAWRIDVAEARNLVVHTGTLPGRQSAVRAIDAMYRFIRFTLDRLISPTTLRTYPMTALILAQRIGLEERNSWTRRMAAAATEADTYDLVGVFARWNTAVNDLLLPDARRPAPRNESAVPTLVHLADGREYWVLRDHQSRSARLARLVDGSFDPRMAQRAKDVKHEGSYTLTFELPPRLRSDGAWMPEHQLVPNMALLRDPAKWAIPPGAPPAKETQA